MKRRLTSFAVVQLYQVCSALRKQDLPHPFGPANMINRAFWGIPRTVRSVNPLKFLIVAQAAPIT